MDGSRSTLRRLILSAPVLVVSIELLLLAGVQPIQPFEPPASKPLQAGPAAIREEPVDLPTFAELIQMKVEMAAIARRADRPPREEAAPKTNWGPF